MHLYNELAKSINSHFERNAFFINDVYYTYAELAQTISNIGQYIESSVDKSEKNIGLVAHGDLETYASILALWFAGKAYVPISPDAPAYRNESILNQIGIKTIIDSSEVPLLPNYQIIESKKLPKSNRNINVEQTAFDHLSFILFTSGSTGIPKGVPISIANLTALLNSFFDEGFNFDENDKFLQMFELSFDMCILMFVIPLLKGACIYTVPKNTIKFSYIHELLEDHKLTVTSMTPSLLLYLRPFFSELNLESVKLSILGGEALPLDLTEEWSKVVPNASIVNNYGPTENTVCCSNYIFNRNGKNKSYNGLLAIGKPMSRNEIIVVDENNRLLGCDEKGELCLGGDQLTSGYWNNPEKNKEVFFYINYLGKQTKFYRTGDLGYIDNDGDIMYIGRIDFQAKIMGYRVELSEVEFYAKEALNKFNAVAIPFNNKFGDTVLGLAVESENCDTKELINYMKKKVPNYMVPSKIILLKELPLSINGKIDRKTLGKLFNS